MSNLLSKQSALLATSRFLERGAYYGVRSIFLLYAIYTLKIDQQEAISLYGIFTWVVYASYLLGGIIGSFALKIKLSVLIGGSMQTMGILLLSVPNIYFFYTGAVLIAIGSGIYSTNVMWAFANSHLTRNGEMSSAFNFFYVAVNLGAFLAPFVLGEVADSSNFTVAFVVAAIIMAGSTLMAYLSNMPNEAVKVKKLQPIGSSLTVVPLILIASTLFWAAYQIGSESIVFHLSSKEETSYSMIDMTFRYVNIGTTMALSIGFFFLWYFVRISNLVKVSLGLVISAVALYFLSLTIHSNSLSSFSIVLICGILLSLAEILVVPTSEAIYSLFTHPKYLALVIGITLFMVIAINKLITIFSYPMEERIAPEIFLNWSALGLLITGVLIGMLRFFIDERPPVLSDSDSELTYSSSDLLDEF